MFLRNTVNTDCCNYRHDPKILRIKKSDRKVSNIRMVQAQTEFRAPSHPRKPIPGGLQKRSPIKVFRL